MKNILKTAAVIAAVAASVAPAKAAVILMVGGVTVADNSSLDANPATGAITYAGTVSGYTISVQTGVASSLPSLDLSNVLTSSTGAGTLTIELTDTGLTTPVGVQNWLSQFTGSFSGPGSPVVTSQTYVDTTNTAFGTATPLASFTASATPFMFSSVNAGGGATPFSITEIVKITTTGAGTNFSLDTQTSLVPEPASLAVLGTGLLGAGLFRKRRRG